MKCVVCGGFGKEGGCPRCGSSPHTFAIEERKKLNVPLDLIPQPYQGLLWEKPESTSSLVFNDFDDKLERVHKEFLSGRLPKFSMFIASPPKGNKHVFAYSCMQSAVVQQFTIAPLLRTSDWRRLYKISQMNPFYKLYEKYTWDSLIVKDVLFLSVDHSDDRFDVITLLKDILDIRAGFCKPTFIISDYKLNSLVPRWGDSSYGTIYNPDTKRDYYRYPVVLHRFAEAN